MNGFGADIIWIPNFKKTQPILTICIVSLQALNISCKLMSGWMDGVYGAIFYNIFIHPIPYTVMPQVSTSDDIERESRRVIGALYGDVSDFRVNATFQIPEKGPREAWDVQVNFMLNSLKYTVDLEMQEKDGQVTNARLIDTMTPL